MPCQLLLRNAQIVKRKKKKKKKFGVPPNTLPLVLYIGIFCYWVLLHYNMSFKTIASGFNGAFWWYCPLSEDQEFLLTHLPKLSCGFKVLYLISFIREVSFGFSLQLSVGLMFCFVLQHFERYHTLESYFLADLLYLCSTHYLSWSSIYSSLVISFLMESSYISSWNYSSD